MHGWDRSKGLAAFEAFGLTGTNAALAVYWLSLWRDDAPPRRADFNPARVKYLLPAISITELRGDGAAICRLAGHYIDLALGGPMRGVDMLSLVSGEARTLRSARLCAVVDGGIGLSRTRFETPECATAIAETLQLPFFGTLEDGSRQFLTHTNWRPHPSDRLAPATRWNGVPDAYRAVALV
jgi:hypothetical protein